MKAIVILLMIPLLSFGVSELFFDFDYTTIDGVNRQMNEFQGKKIMVIVLPVTQTNGDLQMLKRLDSLSIKDSSKYTMIGIPSIEDGYSQDSIAILKVWYRNVLHDQFILTTGMYTRKNSPSQNPLFHWLTNKSENMHFDEDVPGPGEMFFINEQGELYGVYSPDADFNEQLLNRMAL